MMREWIMSGHRFCLGLVSLFCSTSLASAILIETGTGRVGGFVLSDDGTKLKISIPTPDGQEKVGEYLHAKIKILHQLNVKRLEGLSSKNPRAYRDYAEELARQEADPEARYMAMRLYLIAAHLAPEQFGSRSLLSMSALASTPAEARKYRALAYLLDPKVRPDLLRVEGDRPAEPAPFDARALGDFTRALRHFRAGQMKPASVTAQHEGVARIFSMAPGHTDLKTFLQWCSDANCPTCRVDGTVVCPTCKGRGQVVNVFKRVELCATCKGRKRVLCPDCGGTHVREPQPDVRRVVLQCELWALEQQGGENAGRKGARDTKSWSAVVQSRRLSPVLPLRLETITRFDPRKCLYRNRRWVAEEAP
jgi:hypothetical protein